MLSHVVLPMCSVGGWEVRPAQPRDVGAIARVVRSAFRGDYSVADGPLLNAQLAAMELSFRMQLGMRLARPNPAAEAMLVAEDEAAGAVVGCADVRVSCFEDVTGEYRGESTQLAKRWPDRFTLRPYMSNLAVAPEARRRGLAKALVEACERQAMTWGFSSLTLEVVCSNEPALSLYRELGYLLHPCNEEVEIAVRRQFWFEREWMPKLRLVKDWTDNEQKLDELSVCDHGLLEPLAPPRSPRGPAAGDDVQRRSDGIN